MTGQPIRIGTRGSTLARVQAGLVATAFEAEGIAHELVLVETEGDRRAPDTAWGEGAFVAAIERALLDGRVDVAVHSAKDVPTLEDARLEIAAYLPRADPLDALVVAAGSTATGIADLPAASRIGTDSPRRAAFLRAQRPDLEIRPLHGNVDTRLRRLDDGEADALVLAVAGLTRLGREDRISERISPDIVPPAPGQGAIAVQVRAGDRVGTAVATLDDRPTRIAVEVERTLLRAAGGGCRAPIGALAEVEGDRVRLLAGLAGADGRTAVGEVVVPVEDASRSAAELAAGLARQLADGAGAPRVLVTRPADPATTLADGLRAHGIQPVVVPAIAIEPVGPGGALDEALRSLGGVSWAVVTSANGARAVTEAARRLAIDVRAARWAAVGRATAEVLGAAGVTDIWLPGRANGATLAAELPVAAGDRVLLLRGSLADDGLPDGLRGRGCDVVAVTAYRTVEAPAGSDATLEAALAAGPLAAVVFASESAVRGLLALASPGRCDELLAVPAICIGPGTASVAAAAGFRVLGQPRAASAGDLAAAAARLLRADPPGRIP